MFKINLSNPIIFWIFIICLTIVTVLINSDFNTDVKNQNQNQKNNTIQEQSFSKNKKNDAYIIDLDNIENIHTVDELEKNIVNQSLGNRLQKVVSLDNISTILYSILISILFIFREKQNRDKIFQLEKKDDDKNIKLAKLQKTIYKDLSSSLKPFEQMIKHDIKLDILDERINEEPKYIIIASKNVLEQIITKLYKNYTNQENTNLNLMMTALYKKRVLNHNMNNYAHIIKAFGNKANHTNKLFDSKEATLVVGSLVEFFGELEKQNLIEQIDV